MHRNYSKLTDYLSGCFCLDREKTKKFIRKIEINGFKFLYELLALSKGVLKVNEVPLIFKERRFGNSKLDIAIVWDFLISIIHLCVGISIISATVHKENKIYMEEDFNLKLHLF